MKTEEPRPVLLKDYTPPAFWIDKVSLTVELDPDATRVTATLSCRRNTDRPAGLPLVLVAPGLGLILSLPAEGYLWLVVSLALGTPTLSMIGCFGAALTVGI